MSQYDIRQQSVAQAGAGYDGRQIGQQGLQKRDPKVLESLGAHLVMVRNRLSNTISRADSISTRVFGVLEEIKEDDARLVANPIESEPAATIPMLKKLVVELDEQVHRLNQSLDKLETLA
jgi:hypothetical protein